ncbi:MAG: hypothetical protein ABEJ58_02460 [Halodesulfurarchaeum sp.]
MSVMNRTLTLLVALSVLVGGVGPVLGASAPADTSTAIDSGPVHAQTTTNESTVGENGTDTLSVPPGVRLAGVVDVHHAEIEGAIEQRAFGRRIAQANTNQTQARVLARTQERLQERLDAIQERLRTLERARENGTISKERYHAQVPGLLVRAETVRHLANRSQAVARGIPTDVLEANGVNVTALERIRTNARTMTGPEVARIARTIAGTDVGAPLGPPEFVPGGPSQHAGGLAGDHPGPRTTIGRQAGNATETTSGPSGPGEGAMNRTTTTVTTTGPDAGNASSDRPSGQQDRPSGQDGSTDRTADRGSTHR